MLRRPLVAGFILVASLACGSSTGTPSVGNADGPPGADAPGTQADGLSCRAPAPDYGPSTDFEIAPAAPLPAGQCPIACGTSAHEPSLGQPNIDVALPYGACAAGTPACAATARVPCTCANAQGPVHGFVCSCESAKWVCRIRSVGAAACVPCDGGTD
jgi:hypothetical protein